MNRRTLLALFPAAAWGQRKRQKKDRPPELEVVEFAARRTSDGRLEIDGRVRNIGTRPQEKVVLHFYAISPDGKVVTTQNGTLPEPVLAPGEESAFQWQARDHVRAVNINIGAENRAGDELAILKPGPYPIE